jgi:hypothetical protein
LKEKKMKKKTSVGFAGGPAPEKGSAQAAKGQPIVVTGKIAHLNQLGGYYISGDVPAQEYMIENQDPQVLEKLLKSDKVVRIEGRRQGAELLIIEKIDGKPYTAKPTPK